MDGVRAERVLAYSALSAVHRGVGRAALELTDEKINESGDPSPRRNARRYFRQ